MGNPFTRRNILGLGAGLAAGALARARKRRRADARPVAGRADPGEPGIPASTPASTTHRAPCGCRRRRCRRCRRRPRRPPKPRSRNMRPSSPRAAGPRCRRSPTARGSASRARRYRPCATQNATGNWIKIVQRVPVRIALDPHELRSIRCRSACRCRWTSTTHQRNGNRLPQLAHSSPELYTTDVYGSVDGVADAARQGDHRRQRSRCRAPATAQTPTAKLAHSTVPSLPANAQLTAGRRGTCITGRIVGAQRTMRRSALTAPRRRSPRRRAGSAGRRSPPRSPARRSRSAPSRCRSRPS